MKATRSGTERTVALAATGAVDVDGATVTLALAEPVVVVDTVTVAYAKPETNPLRDADNAKLPVTGFDDTKTAINATPITNLQPGGALVSNLGQRTDTSSSPSVSAWAQGFTTASGLDGSLLTGVELKWGGSRSGVSAKIVTGFPSATKDFTTLVNRSPAFGNLRFAAPANTVLLPGTTYHVVIEGSTGHWSHTESGSEDGGGVTGWSIADKRYWRNSSGTWLQRSLVQQISVTGSVIDYTAPTFVSAAVDGATLVLTFSEDLDTDSVPAPGAFSVAVGSGRRNVTEGGVAIAGKTVTLTLDRTVLSTDTVRVRYSKPSGSPLQDVAGHDAETFAEKAVTNNTDASVVLAPTLPAACGAATGSRSISVSSTSTSITVTLGTAGPGGTARYDVVLCGPFGTDGAIATATFSHISGSW